MKKESKFKDN